MLELGSYKHLLDLFPPASSREEVPLSPSELVEMQLSVLSHLLRELPFSPRLPTSHQLVNYLFSQRDSLLRSLLTVRDPIEHAPLPEEVREKVDLLVRHCNQRNPDPLVPVESIPFLSSLYSADKSSPAVIPSPSSPSSSSLHPAPSAPSSAEPPSPELALPSSFSRIRIHQGDFTRLSGSGVAVVNPANVRMLGCFQPSHLCADNVLHAARGSNLPRDSVRSLRRRIDAASTWQKEVGNISTVAFTCISTGIFAFPGGLAAQIALSTIDSWLSCHPSSSCSVKEVVFVLFSDTDAANCRADAVNEEVGHGLDYTSEALFKQLYPGLLRSTDMRCLYHSIGYHFDDNLVKFAFLLEHGYNTLTWASPSPPSVYSALLSYAKSRPSGFTVLTSNADQLFLHSGFPSSHLYTP
ncbi:hypothetical protein JCM10213_007495 [Rhodosporidiobolus nylandii]